MLSIKAYSENFKGYEDFINKRRIYEIIYRFPLLPRQELGKQRKCYLYAPRQAQAAVSELVELLKISNDFLIREEHHSMPSVIVACDT